MHNILCIIALQIAFPQFVNFAQLFDALSSGQNYNEDAFIDDRIPSNNNIEFLENALLTHKCGRKFKGGNKRYSYGATQDRRIDTDKIQFSMRSSACNTETCRHIVPYRLFPLLDDSNVDLFTGKYLMSKDILIVEYCGPNRPQLLE